jgi:ribonuclease Z
MELVYSTENKGETFLKIKVKNQFYTLRGFSRAGLRTCILCDEFNVCFDMGYSNDRAFSYDNKLISHGHCDHIGGLHFDHCARRLFKITKERQLIMPYQCIKPFKMMATAVSEMNSGRSGEHMTIFNELLLTNIVESESCIDYYCGLIGKTKPISEYVVKAFLMDHKIKSYGYIIYRMSKKLKPEFHGLTKNEIIKIKKEIGEEHLTEQTLTPLLGYTGDTTIHGVLRNPEFLTVPLLIMECTGFSPEDKEDCLIGKHIHFDDIIENKHYFENEKIVLFHFSQKYGKIEELDDFIKDKFNKIILFY